MKFTQQVGGGASVETSSLEDRLLAVQLANQGEGVLVVKLTDWGWGGGCSYNYFTVGSESSSQWGASRSISQI